MCSYQDPRSLAPVLELDYKNLKPFQALCCGLLALAPKWTWMLALAVEGALTQAYDPGYDGPVVAAFSKFEADGR